MTPYLGEIRMFGGNFAPLGWALCQGQQLAISENDALFNLIGTTYGGDGQSTFALPNLASRLPMHLGSGFILGQMGGEETVTLSTKQVPVHTHPVMASTATGAQTSPAANVLASSSSVKLYNGNTPNQSLADKTIEPAGGGQPHDNMQPFLAINFIIALEGIYPSPSSGGPSDDDQYIAEIRNFPFGYPPVGWAECNGQLLAISHNTALFALLGTTYGGDGKTTFALPNLMGSAPMQQGQGQGLSLRDLGEVGGEPTVTLIASEMPVHNHGLEAFAGRGVNSNLADSTVTLSSSQGNFVYDTTTPQSPAHMDPGTLIPMGGSQPHNNLQPCLTSDFCIATQGIFPPRG
jgi:microcystin-dependent protein